MVLAYNTLSYKALCVHPLSLSLSLSLFYMHTYTPTHTPSLSLTHTHTHTHTPSLSHTHEQKLRSQSIKVGTQDSSRAKNLLDEVWVTRAQNLVRFYQDDLGHDAETARNTVR